MDLERSSTAEWLDGLKAGSEVVVFGGQFIELRKVSRTTATLIILESEHERFKRADGSKTPRARFYNRWIRPATDKDRAECYERKIRADIARIQWDKVPLTNLLDVLRQIP